jgi:ribosomal 50S subunit-recycling heat shock protein
VRFDVALFELRLVKSRSQAAGAIQSGDVLLNGATCKPSHTVRAGDRITLGGRTLEVLGLPTRSLSREQAKELVREASAG